VERRGFIKDIMEREGEPDGCLAAFGEGGGERCDERRLDASLGARRSLGLVVGLLEPLRDGMRVHF
jgi:hypothetical protein